MCIVNIDGSIHSCCMMRVDIIIILLPPILYYIYIYICIINSMAKHMCNLGDNTMSLNDWL